MIDAYLQGGNMMKWSLIFFVIAMVAGALGFTGIAPALAGISIILFFLFTALSAFTLLYSLSNIKLHNMKLHRPK
jgi:uncharacterized membrane protein YtjA (UPF0391 family)